MPDLTPFIAQWGYAAIFVIVILGNVGLPVPEETILTVSGYLIWQGRLQPLPVLLTAIASAVLGDNVAYWVGRRYGRLALTRFLKIGPEPATPPIPSRASATGSTSTRRTTGTVIPRPDCRSRARSGPAPGH